MYLFLIIGLLVLSFPFLSDQLKTVSRKSKAIAFGIIFLVGGTFVYIGANALYEDFFEAYPSVPIQKFSDDIFEDYNSVKNKYKGEDVIDIVTESSRLACSKNYCTKETWKMLFEAADLDSNKRVTRKELYELIHKFDTNKDGLLNFPKAKIKTLFGEEKKSELKIFNSAFPVTYGKRLPRDE